MTRHKHHKLKIDRSDRFKVILSELATQTGLPKSDLNLVQCAWIALAQENLQSAILAGAIVEIGELEKYSAALKDIMPSKPHDLNLRFVGTIDHCPRCNFERDAKPEPEPLPEPAAQPVHAFTMGDGSPSANDHSNAPATPPAPAPSNVTPLRSVHDHVFAPLVREEPWRSCIGNEFRRFDVPENF